MKEVKIKRIELQNFKGVKELTVDFGEHTTISGRNASGKTTIFDAFTWCLFGKDSQGRSDSSNGGFMVKTADSEGRAIPMLEHIVSVTLSVDGVETVFTRQLVEEWGTQRGDSVQRFKGNTTHYYVDGVEVNATKGENNYEKAVSDVIPETLFRQISDPTNFPTLPWKEQREMLLIIAGNVTLEDVADNDQTYMAVLNEMSGKNVDDYKKSVASQRKKIEEDIKLIPARISGIQIATPQADDYTAIETELQEKETLLATITNDIMNVASVNRRKYEAIKEKQNAIYAKEQRQREVVQAAKDQATQKYYEANAKRRDALSRIEVLRKQDLDIIARTSQDKARIAEARKTYEKHLEQMQQKRTELLLKWEERNAEVYIENVASDHFTCPLCKEIECRNEFLLKHDAETRVAECEAWHLEQERDLAAITEEGKRINATIAELTAQIERAKAEEEATAERGANEQKAISEELKKLHSFIQQMPEEALSSICETDLPEYVELQHQIAVIKSEIEQAEASDPTADTSEMQIKQAETQKAIAELKSRLATRTVIEENQRKIEAEQATLQRLDEQKAELESKEMAVETLVHKQSEEIERRVNSLFQLVKFRMFEEQTNGGERPTCVAMVDGVRYGDLNDAMKINAGLDIINTICAYIQVTAPIFIDNAESVNTLHPTKSQVIRLVVTTEPLTITNA